MLKRFLEFINENSQLADKNYFNNGILDESDKDLVYSVTNGDSYTNFIAGVVAFDKSIHFLNYGSPQYYIPRLNKVYTSIKNYDKNIFPYLKPINIYSTQVDFDLIEFLITRYEVDKIFNKLPSIAKRNLRSEFKKTFSYSDLKSLLDLLRYLEVHLHYLSNRPIEVREKFYKSIFKSGNTLGEILSKLDDKESLIGGVEITKEYIIEVTENYDCEITFDENDVMIVKVEEYDALVEIGCNSLWCFSYKSDSYYRQWNEYSYNDIVYILIDFREPSDSPDFMYTVIKPFDFDDDLDNEQDSSLFNMINQPVSSYEYVLENLFGDDYMDVVGEYLNFDE